jgi:hypothetical protein
MQRNSITVLRRILFVQKNKSLPSDTQKRRGKTMKGIFGKIPAALENSLAANSITFCDRDGFMSPHTHIIQLIEIKQ